ncbi:MAG: amidohydrolase family protein [Desulfobaccales bacterium]|jgi:predicted TIM-barrel fold metal-dependent hydrolase
MAPAHSCDTHAHIFGPADLYPMVPGRSYTPPEASIPAYARLLSALGFERAVIIQPSVYGTDNRCTYDAVRQSGGKWRGVAVVHPQVTSEELQALHEAGFRGVRINLLFKGGLMMDVLEQMARRIAPWGWHLQLLVAGRDLVDLAPRFRQLPVLSVIDHMGHLPAALTVRHPAFAALLSLVREGRCWVKLSGAYRISSKPFPYDDVVPMAQALVEAGPEQMVWGSDWPHPSFVGEMPVDAGLLDLLTEWVPDPCLRHRILVENPARLYDFPPGD